MASPGTADYANYLPASWRNKVDQEPTSTWWDWRGPETYVLRRANSNAHARVLLVHDAGGHSAVLWPISPLLPEAQVKLAAIDMPLYGETISPYPAKVRHDDWVSLLCEFVHDKNDGRPLVLLGASIGGMLTYEAAARTCLAAAVAATCLLNPRDMRARAVISAAR